MIGAVASILDSVQIGRDLRSASFGTWTVSAAESRDLEKRLGHALYEHLHLRREDAAVVRARMVREPAFEARLRAEVRRPEILVPAPVIEHHEDRRLVELMGVRVWVPADRVTPDGLTVRLDAAHSTLSPGFLMVQGPAAAQPVPRHRLRRIYLNPRDPDAAVVVWGRVLELVEAIEPSYRAKAASVSWFYPRTDAVTVYVRDDTLEAAVRSLVVALDDARLLDPRTSLLCQQVAPGMAVAAEPVDTSPGRIGLSYGEHRSSLLARALVQAAGTGRDWRAVLPAALDAAQVDAAAIWRNAPHDSMSVAVAGIAPSASREEVKHEHA